MTTKPIIEERIAFYENLIDKYSKNQKYTSRLETTRSLLEFWKAQLRKFNLTENRKQEEQI